MKHQITPYLIFNGNAKEALKFYKELFDGEISDVQTYKEADFPTPPEAENRIMHARFKKGELFFMVSDSFPNQDVETGSNISLVLEFDKQEEMDTVYHHLAENGTVAMELQDTFWGARYAKVKDAFGVTWDLNYTHSK
ncbi:3-demethylubiquinone-9 3-methyltransferase [Planococcus donghaensis MPA1U2]|uniref:3-demethylubiquinone-9 3-methyltransferase n=1 Tax=Planococcus donghaensis MPA1U2 TaxID=933115 RepID=E7RDG4_9BACL|nr:VOC family protein [Planococcus donghaensis]EGA90968.1 3-demethylubiquinone-9 3-methyltransferase [Planococcus donghaensis MPA1U2]